MWRRYRDGFRLIVVWSHVHTSSHVLAAVSSAFSGVLRPGPEDIIHCEYDRAWGGPLEGPCRECTEVVEFFRKAARIGLPPSALSDVAHGLASFTPKAFAFWLPAFIEVSLCSDQAGWRCRESIDFRLRSLESEAWQKEHIGALNSQQLGSLRMYFEYLREDPGEDPELIDEALSTLTKWECGGGK